MARPDLSPAKAVLLAVELAGKAEIPALQTLILHHRTTLRTELVLRILLSHLPESLDSAEYVPFLKGLFDDSLAEIPDISFDTSTVNELSEKEARGTVKRLNLLHLAWPNAPADVPQDPIVLFLIHRSLRIDDSTGLITQIPELLAPFLHHSQYLRIWLITTILPLLRLYYEYHPNKNATISISSFRRLDDEAGIALLLSGARNQDGQGGESTVGRDLRGLVGPWMYGDTRSKQRKLMRESSFAARSIAPLDVVPDANEKCASWENVFTWITTQSTTSWETAVQAIEQWDGPGDVDLGGYDGGTELLGEEDQQRLERRYAQSALAAAYLITDLSPEALLGVNKILNRLIVLLDLERVPTLEASGALLIPVEGNNDCFSWKDAVFLQNRILDENNTLTKPNEASLKFLHAALISAFLMTRNLRAMTVKEAAGLALRQNTEAQMVAFRVVLINSIKLGKSGDDKFWVRLRNEMLWLRTWGIEETTEAAVTPYGKGIFGSISREEMEAVILKAFLTNNRIQLAQSIYNKSSDFPLSTDVLHVTVISSAMEAYDNATNANKTRGGVKRCRDILNAFPSTVESFAEARRLSELIELTHLLGAYRLVLKQGEPFTPVILRLHDDPISIIGKIIDQNSRVYTKINDLVDLGKRMVNAGLTGRASTGNTTLADEPGPEQELIAEKRVTCMCICAALADDDFETAYSYVVSRLENIARPAHSRIPEVVTDLGLIASWPTKVEDKWSWNAALEAGKYHRNSYTVKPTHLGNASGNLEIRHLQQRMECLSLALRCAPLSALQAVLNVFRRCEEELETQVKQEEEQEAAWDTQGDDQAMPGGFDSTKGSERMQSSSQPAEEAPMSLFDLSRASMARAQKGLSALSIIQDEKPKNGGISHSLKDDDQKSVEQRARKRDQLRNAAVGTLASGVGWLIGAPATPEKSDPSD